MKWILKYRITHFMKAKELSILKRDFMILFSKSLYGIIIALRKWNVSQMSDVVHEPLVLNANLHQVIEIHMNQKTGCQLRQECSYVYVKTPGRTH